MSKIFYFEIHTYILSSSDWFGAVKLLENHDIIVVSSSNLRANNLMILTIADVTKNIIPQMRIALFSEKESS